jgi:hypothetical protein
MNQAERGLHVEGGEDGGGGGRGRGGGYDFVNLALGQTSVLGQIRREVVWIVGYGQCRSSHVTRHMSHVTRHTSHVTPATLCPQAAESS